LRYHRGCSPAVAILVILSGLFSAGNLASDPLTNLTLINEVYSNADGSLQYVELIARGNFSDALDLSRLIAIDASGTDTSLLIDFTDPFVQLNTFETILIATQSVADTLGFTPDFIIPAGLITPRSGRILYRRDSGPILDAVAYGSYAGSNSGYGTPAPTLPCDGVSALQRMLYDFTTPNNIEDWAVATNTPQRNDSTAGAISPAEDTRPNWNPIGAKNVNENVHLLFFPSAYDCDGSIPQLTIYDLPSGATFYDSTTGKGRFSFKPTYLQSGVYNVGFVASDGSTADTEIVTITVNEITDPPVARDTTYNLLEDSSIACLLTATDPDSDPLIYTILALPTHGDLTDLDTLAGTFTYSADPDYSGSDFLRFRVRDGLVNSNSDTVFFVIAAVNDPPTAGDWAATTGVDLPISFGAMPVSDVDDVVWTVAHTAGPFHGSVGSFNPATGAFQYTPSTGYTGPDSIRYIANDGEDISDTATIRITVSAGCNCTYHADVYPDTELNAADLATLIDIVFFGGSDSIDPSCPHVGRGDYNCDCLVDSIDLAAMIDGVFFGGVGPCDPCTPGDECP